MKVTIYISGMIGVTATEARLVAHGRKQYAQYKDAPFIHFKPKGKRKVRGWCEGYKPFAVVVEGWGHPAPPSPWVEEPSGVEGLFIRKGKYSGYDSGYETDFNVWFSTQSFPVVVDYRATPETVAVAA